MFIAAVLALVTATPQQPPAKPRLSTALILHTDVAIPRDEQQFPLTSVAQGVLFDLDADGIPEKTAWTAPGSKLAFLAFDRNGNGTIDDGKELFGNHTESRVPNGIAALTNMLKAAGAPLSGSSHAGDPLYDKLLLWEDANHNGLSEPSELRPARELFTALGLGYGYPNSLLEHGNVLRCDGWAEIRTEDLEQGRSDGSAAHRLRLRRMLEIGFASLQK